MGDGFESVFDLVETSFWGEDGRLWVIVSSCGEAGSGGWSSGHTLESYLRDMMRKYLVNGLKLDLFLEWGKMRIYSSPKVMTDLWC